MEILEKQKLVLNNIICIRKNVTQLDFAKEVRKIKEILDANDILSPTWITAIHGQKMVPGSLPLMDVELLVQVDKSELYNSAYQIKKEFIIENAVCIHYEGAPQELSLVHKNIVAHIKRKKFRPSTAIYTISDVNPLITLPTMKASVYVGIG